MHNEYLLISLKPSLTYFSNTDWIAFKILLDLCLIFNVFGLWDLIAWKWVYFFQSNSDLISKAKMCLLALCLLIILNALALWRKLKLCTRFDIIWFFVRVLGFSFCKIVRLVYYKSIRILVGWHVFWLDEVAELRNAFLALDDFRFLLSG